VAASGIVDTVGTGAFTLSIPLGPTRSNATPTPNHFPWLWVTCGLVDTLSRGVAGKDVPMPPVPSEFKRDVVAVARRGGLTRAEIAADFGISESTMKRWMTQADVDDGIRDGLTTAEQAEVVQLRRDKRRLEMENEILRRAAAYFAKDALPK
jgi:transposase